MSRGKLVPALQVGTAFRRDFFMPRYTCERAPYMHAGSYFCSVFWYDNQIEMEV